MGSYRDYSSPKRLKVTYSTTKVMMAKENEDPVRIATIMPV